PPAALPHHGPADKRPRRPLASARSSRHRPAGEDAARPVAGSGRAPPRSLPRSARPRPATRSAAIGWIRPPRASPPVNAETGTWHEHINNSLYASQPGIAEAKIRHSAFLQPACPPCADVSRASLFDPQTRDRIG